MLCNYEGNSDGMESELALRSLNKLSDEYDLHGIKFIADGDSTLFSKLWDNLDWSIVKVECLNHLIKNYKGNLIEARDSCKLTKVLTDHLINRMCAYVRTVINIYGDENPLKKPSTGRECTC